MSYTLTTEDYADGNHTSQAFKIQNGAVTLTHAAGAGSVKMQASNTPEIDASWRDVVTLTAPGQATVPVPESHVRFVTSGAIEYAASCPEGVLLALPGSTWVPVTPHDTTVVDARIMYLINAGASAGTVAVEDYAGTTTTVTLQPGQLLPFRSPKRIKATGTTATVAGVRL